MADSNPTTKAVADLRKNRLEVTISGTINTEILEKLYTEIRFCVADLKSGFEVISDVSRCNIIYLTSLPVYKKIMDYLIANNIGEHVRITSNENISTKQILHFSEKIDTYKSIQAKSREEAEEKIEEFKKRKGIRLKFNAFFFEYEIENKSSKGSIIDISTSGCAFEAEQKSFLVDSEFFIILTFEQHQDLVTKMRIKAKVVRARETIFAAQFLDLDDNRQEQLYKRLAYEISRVPFQP
jgi:hypothetical protein